jgi:hypothetical protein
MLFWSLVRIFSTYDKRSSAIATRKAQVVMKHTKATMFYYCSSDEFEGSLFDEEKA